MSNLSEEEIIKEIKERIIEPFYCFPNPTSIELKDKDVNLIEELIDLYIKLQYKLEVEKIDNKYNQEERDEETIPRYKIREKIETWESICRAEQLEGLNDNHTEYWSCFEDVLEKIKEQLLQEGDK